MAFGGQFVCLTSSVIGPNSIREEADSRDVLSAGNGSCIDVHIKNWLLLIHLNEKRSCHSLEQSCSHSLSSCCFLLPLVAPWKHKALCNYFPIVTAALQMNHLSHWQQSPVLKCTRLLS